MLRRGRVTIADLAGLEETEAGDEVAQQMRAASIKAVQSADIVVLIRESGDIAAEIALPVEPSLRVCTKIDLPGERWGDLGVSALTSEGLQELVDRLDLLAFGDASTGSTLALTVRHLKCVEDARAALHRADIAGEAELIALELREALDQLGEILGSITPDDVLGRIFSKFCIGK
jgi:tRNA modification GTPase